MRLVYRRDRDGRLVEAVDGGVAGTAAPRHALEAALVVDEDPDMRIMMRRILEAEGYAVATCPGPRGTHCKAARHGARAETPCDRVPENTRIFILDNVAKQTHLREAYESWFPDAEVLDSP